MSVSDSGFFSPEMKSGGRYQLDTYHRKTTNPRLSLDYYSPSSGENITEKTNFHKGWTDEPKDKDPAKPLVNFCRKILANVHTENYKNFFQGLLADLTDDDFLGETCLQPVPRAQQDGYILLDENIVPREAYFAEVTAPNTNYVTCKIALKNGLGFLILEKDPLTYAEIYDILKLKKISTLRVKFTRQLDK